MYVYIWYHISHQSEDYAARVNDGGDPGFFSYPFLDSSVSMIFAKGFDR
jgi:hypothetical protein